MIFEAGRQFSGFWALLRTLLLIASIACAPFAPAAALETPCPGHGAEAGAASHHAHKPHAPKRAPVDQCCIGGLQASLPAPVLTDMVVADGATILKRPLPVREASTASFLPETPDRPPRLFA